jgi:hypothetical protein
MLYSLGACEYSERGRLKPFLPQLQTTFVKSLQNSSRSVRLKAVLALGKMVPLQMKVDPLVTELNTSLKAGGGDSEDPEGVTEAICRAVRVVLEQVGGKVTAKVMEVITPTVFELLAHPSEEVRTAAGGAAGMCIACAEDPAPLVNMTLSVGPSAEWTARQGVILALSSALAAPTPPVCTIDMMGQISSAINDCVADSRGPVRQAGVAALGVCCIYFLNASRILRASYLNEFCTATRFAGFGLSEARCGLWDQPQTTGIIDE